MSKRKAKRSRGFGETQKRFVRALDLSAVLSTYGSACAFTGADLTAEASADPGGVMLRLGPDQSATDPTLVVPACIDAMYAYERGHLALGPRYNFLVNLEAISPELLEVLNPIGRLRLPEDERYNPSKSAIEAHRTAFASIKRR